jgi:hypothetical protein
MEMSVRQANVSEALGLSAKACSFQVKEPEKPKKKRVANVCYVSVENAMEWCCRESILVICSCGKYEKVIPITCGIMICPKKDCIEQRYMRRKMKYINFLKSFKNPYFLTLTRKDLHPLSHQYKKEMDIAFQKMSRHTFKGKVHAWLKVLEMGHREYVRPDIYNRHEYVEVYRYHYHIVLDLEYLDQVDISEVRKWWIKYTSSPRVNVKRCRGTGKLMDYLNKYCQKGSEINAELHEFLGIRKMQFFSRWVDPKHRAEYDYSVPLSDNMVCPFCKNRMHAITKYD